MPDQPVPLEVAVSASVGGKVQIVKYEYDENYFISMTQRWSVPEDWTEEELAVFRKYQYSKLREQVQELGQTEVDALMASRDAPLSRDNA